MTNRKKGLSSIIGLVATGIMSVSYVHAQSGSTIAAPQFTGAAPQFANAAPQYGSADVFQPAFNSAAPAASQSRGGLLGNWLPSRSNVGEDPWTLFGRRDNGLNIGGWFSAGYHEESNGLFNTTPDSFSLQQAWLFAEKAADASDGGIDFGYRFDGVYGTDGPDTQSFGNSGSTFDLNPNFTRGGQFGWAIPQAYGEIAAGKWNVKVGHFYTLVGYEVVTAPDNFFYSHSITSFNSEPFTHTGAIASYSVNDDLTIYGGWTAGWDSGFDFAAGSNFLGGFSRSLSDNATLTYITTFGDFGARSAGNDDAYSHSIVLDMQLTENLNYVVQSDLLRIGSTGEDNIGLNQYLLYTASDTLSYGARLEWWKADEVTGFAPHGGVFPAGGGSHSYYETTFGMNYKIDRNITLRPEYRVDWSPALGYSEGFFGMDVVATF